MVSGMRRCGRGAAPAAAASLATPHLPTPRLGMPRAALLGAALVGVALSMGWCAAAVPAPAAQYRAGNMRVTQPWSSPTPPAVAVGAVYFVMTNTGRSADRLTAITSPIAREVQIHESRTVQGMMQMRRVASVQCPPGAVVKSEPGALHVMLLGLSRPLTAGMEFPMSLHFRDAGVLLVQVRVGPAP